MIKQITLTVNLLLVSITLWGQFGTVPVRDQGNSLEATLILDGYELPGVEITDKIVAVDATDAFIILGEGLTGDNGGGMHIAGLYINNPSPSTKFSLILFDVSSGEYHFIEDGSGNVLIFDYVESGVEAGMVAGYENATSPAGPYPGTVAVNPVGLPDFIDAQGLLPVNFTAFTATNLGKTIGLNWSTGTESDNDFYAVERSADGEVFTEIGRVNGAGESRDNNDYDFTDDEPLSGLNYYRLRQVDFDGSFSFSNVVFIQNDAALEAEVKVFPNPASGQTVVNVSGDWASEMVAATLLDINGRALQAWKQATNSSETIYLATLSSGVYQLLLTDGTNQRVQRLVVR